MPSGPGERYDFFLSRRGSVAAVAQEVTNVLLEKGYKVNVEDYDFRPGASFVEAMHEGIKNSRDLLILYTADYEASLYTRKEFTSFVAEMAQSTVERHIIILRCEDVPLRGLLSDIPFQDLVGVHDPQERKRRIIAVAERQTQAAPPPPRPFIGVPPRIASFTGRADELDRLDAILMHDKPAAVTQAVGRAAVQGMGGVGKTSLAIEYAHRFRGLYAGVCWCPAETRTGLLSALAGLAVTMGAATTDEADVEKAAKAGLRKLAEQRATWLLVYDNVPAPDAIADLLPSAGARVLITSRFSDWGEVADEVTLDVLPLEEAVAFLQSRTAHSDARGGRTLAETLGNLPLALDHAGAYCKRTQMRFGDYAAKASSLIDTAPRGAGYPRSVAATFNLAITEAVAQCRTAEALMAYFAHCAPERIPMTLVDGAIEDEAERLKALAALVEVSLVKHVPLNDTTPAVIVHRLVQAAARARPEATEWTSYAIARLIARLMEIYPADTARDPLSWPLFAQITPHLFALRDALFDRAMANRETALGPEQPDAAYSLHSLAWVLQGQDDLAGTGPLYERALAIHEEVLAPGRADAATSLNDLAFVLWRDQRDFAGARPLFERALAIYEKALGPKHQSTNRARLSLFRFLLLIGPPTATLALSEAALAAHDNAFGPGHAWTKDSARVTADALDALGRTEEAKALREKYGLTEAEKPKAS